MKKILTATTLADQAEENIIEYIKKNHLVPGDSLPGEMEFSEMMGISRNIVREAMSRLRMLGLIQSRTKRGIIVTEPSLLNGFSKVLGPELLSISAIKDLMGMRIALEIGITDFIFRNITDRDIQELELIVSRQEALGINILTIEDELKFHLKIYEIAGNNFIMKFQELMNPVFVFAKRNYENYFKPVNQELDRDNLIVTHSDILKILKKGDIEGYRNAVRQHLAPYNKFINDFIVE